MCVYDFTVPSIAVGDASDAFAQSICTSVNGLGNGLAQYQMRSKSRRMKILA